MSWLANLEALQQKGNVDLGGIYDSESGNAYAETPGFTLSKHNVQLENEVGEKINSEVDEISVLKQVLNGQDIQTPPGVWLNKTRYHLISYDGDTHTAYLKSDNGGAALVRTNKLLLVGTWSVDKKQSGGNCNLDIDGLAQNLLKINY